VTRSTTSNRRPDRRTSSPIRSCATGSVSECWLSTATLFSVGSTSSDDVRRIVSRRSRHVEQVHRQATHVDQPNDGRHAAHGARLRKGQVDVAHGSAAVDLRPSRLSRMEYDAHRQDYERLIRQQQSDGIATLSLSAAEQVTQKKYLEFQQRYEKAKDQLTIKLKLLEDNRVCSRFASLVRRRDTGRFRLSGQRAETTVGRASSSHPQLFLSQSTTAQSLISSSSVFRRPLSFVDSSVLLTLVFGGFSRSGYFLC
jgi:hypothetical protein